MRETIYIKDNRLFNLLNYLTEHCLSLKCKDKKKKDVYSGLSLSRRLASLTSPNHLACHEESRGASGAIVVDIDDGDPGQAQAVVNGPLPTCGVP